MRILTVIAVSTTLAVVSYAQNDKTALKAELRDLNQRVLSSVLTTRKSTATFIDRESGEIHERAIRFQHRITKFSGCGLSLSNISTNRRRQEYFDIKAYVPLQHVDLANTRTSISKNMVQVQFVTTGSRIRVNQFSSAPSIMTGENRQSSIVRLTNEFTLRLEATESPERVVLDLRRAVEICGLI